MWQNLMFKMFIIIKMTLKNYDNFPLNILTIVSVYFSYMS